MLSRHSLRLLPALFTTGLLLTGSAAAAQSQSLFIPDVGMQAARQWYMWGCISVLLFLLAYSSFTLFRHERKKERFAPVISRAHVVEQWLEDHLYTMLPEEVGAVWDRRAGNETAALLARMVVEKKMSSWLEPIMFPFLNRHMPGRYVLYLSLLQSGNTLSGHEQDIAERLFIHGDTINTRRLGSPFRKSRKFQQLPLRWKFLRPRMEVLKQALRHPLKYRELWMPAGMAASFVILVGNGFLHRYELALTLIGALAGVAGLIAGSLAGYAYRRQTDGLRLKWLSVHLVPVILLLVFVLFSFSGSSILLLTGLTFLYGTAICTSIFSAGTTENREKVALRKKLAAARKFFQKELQKEQPALDDSHLPFLLALGLGYSLGSWNRRFAGTRRSGSRGVGGYRFSGGSVSFGGHAAGVWAERAGSLHLYAGHDGRNRGDDAVKAQDSSRIGFAKGKIPEKVVEGGDDG